MSQEETLHQMLEGFLQGPVTPAMYKIMADALVHMGILGNVGLNEMFLIFAETLGSHLPGIDGIEIRLFGETTATQLQNGMFGEFQAEKPKPSADDATARRLLDW